MGRSIQSPLELAGLHTWLRADLGVVKEGATQKVEQWQDQSGNGHHFIQLGATTLKPLFTANAINGLPGIVGDGVDDVLDCASFTLPLPYTILYVFKTVSYPTVSGIIIGGSQSYLANENSSPTLFRATMGGTSPSMDSAPQLPPGAYHLGTVTVGGNVTTAATGHGLVRANGAGRHRLVAGGTAGSMPSCDLFKNVGLARYGNAELAEVIFYSRQVAWGEMELLERYIARRYAPFIATPRVPLFMADQLSGLAAWYRADQGLTLDSAGRVTIWSDLSGNGRDLAQATPTMRPRPALLHEGPLNGRAAVIFDGSDDFLQSATFTLAQPTTVIIVWKAVTIGTGSHDCLFDGGAVAGVNSMGFYQDNTSLAFIYAQGAQILSIAANVANGVYACLTAVFQGTSSFWRINGVNRAGPGINIGAFAANGLTLGSCSNGTRTTNAAISEVAVYNRVLTAAEMQLFEHANTGRYSVPSV